MAGVNNNRYASISASANNFLSQPIEVQLDTEQIYQNDDIEPVMGKTGESDDLVQGAMEDFLACNENTDTSNIR